jgi:hydrogenase maturation protease
MYRTLILGYGNIDRADDGVAYHVINALRRRLGHAPLHEYDTGMEDLGAEADTIFVTQLTPEMMDVLADYHRIIFVDAHVTENVDDLHCAPLPLQEDASLTFTHHISPAMLLALMKTLYHRDLIGHTVSIRGRDFDFHRTLSAEAEALIVPAVDNIMKILAA